MATPSRSTTDNTDSNRTKTTGCSTRAASKNLQLAEESAKGTSTPAVPFVKGKVTTALQPKPGAHSQKAPAVQPLPSGSSALQGSIEPINSSGEDPSPLHGVDQVLSDAPSLMYLTTISSISTLGNKDPKASMESRRIFEGIPTFEEVMVYDKPLSASLSHYHHRFNPAIDDDPLVFFCGIDRKLPGKSLEDSQGIRDILWRWYSPHVEGLWVDLPTIIDEFHWVRLTPDLIKDFTVNSIMYYSVPPLFLQEVAQLYLAMYQILEAFQTFLEEGDRQPFAFDTEWKMLWMLAWHTNKKDILIAFVVLWHCCEVCNSHIKEYFNAMCKMFLQMDEQESVSTMYSTRPSVRSQFGRGSVHEEVGKLLLRPDYNSCIPVVYRDGISRLTEAAVSAANKMHEKIPTDFYKDTCACIHQIQPTGIITAARSASNASYKVRALDQAFAKTSQVAYTNTNSQSNRAFSQYAPSTTHTIATQSVKVPMPTSISVIDWWLPLLS